jgi:uncharacterized membrane protein YccC
VQRFLPQLDTTSVQIALKSCIALVIFTALSLQLDWKHSFGAILVVVLQTPALGATLKKGIQYTAATLGGAIVALVLIALFGHDRGAFILASALLITFSTYRQQISRYPYAWLIFSVTVILVGFFSHKAFDYSFQIAVWRASPVCLAVIIVFLVHGIIWPMPAGKTFEQQLHGFVEGCRGLLSLMSRTLAGDAPDPVALGKAGSAQVKALGALRGTLDAAANDTERFRRHRAGYEWLLDQLHSLLLAILVVRESIDNGRGDSSGRTRTAASDELRSMLERIEGDMQELTHDLASPRNGTARPRAPGAEAAVTFDQTGTFDTADDAILAGSLRDLARQVSNVRATLACVEDPGQVPPPRPAPPCEPFSLTSVKSRKAAAGGLVILLLGWFFIQTQWPMGLMLGMVFASIVVTFNAMVPLIFISRQLLFSLVIGTAIAAPLYFGIMPRISTFPQLVPWLIVAFFPLFYLMASKPQKTMQYLFAAIFVAALPSLDESGQSYSFSSFANMWFGFFGGFAGALAIFGLFSSIVPEREFCKQVRSFFAGCGQFATGFRERARKAREEAAIVSTGPEQWQPVLKHLQMWSSQINYERVPGNDRHKTQALIESIEQIALRLPAAERVGQPSAEALDEPLRKLFGRFYDVCAESFQLIVNSLAAQRPIPELPETGSLLREIESRGDDLRRSAGGDQDARASILRLMGTTARLGSLAGAIQDSRDKVNALDWAAWNRNYL